MSDQARTVSEASIECLIQIARESAENGGAQLDERLDTVGVLRADIADIASQAEQLDKAIGRLVRDLDAAYNFAQAQWHLNNVRTTQEALRGKLPLVDVNSKDWHAGYLGGYASGLQEAIRYVRLHLQGITR